MRLTLTLLPALLLGPAAVVAVPETPTPPGPWQSPPRLDPPAGRVVRVGTEAELQQAVRNLRSNTTILIEPGTYRLTKSLQIDRNPPGGRQRGRRRRGHHPGVERDGQHGLLLRRRGADRSSDRSPTAS